MKRCSSCDRIYDNPIKFCLDDGTPLSVSIEGLDSSSVVDKQPVRLGIKGNWTSPYTLAAIIASLLLFGLPAILYLRSNSNVDYSSKPDLVSNGRETRPLAANRDFQSVSNVAATANQMVNIANNRSDSPSPIRSVDVETTKREISDRINVWKQASEARDLSSYMRNYAEMVDYYKKRSASKSFVSNDKGKAFSKFDSISLTIDVVDVTVDPNGNHANAIIDKEWLFQGGGYLAGKVRQQLQFGLIGGEWLIIAEKDLKVFYVNR